MSTMRIGGLASGMDTETMVKDLMKAERVRLDKYNQSKQTSLWKQELYNDVNKDIANFILDTKKELGLTTTSSSGLLLSNSVSNLSWVKKATSSDETIVSATATSSAVTGTHSIEVIKLAKGINDASSSAIGALGDLTGKTVTFETNKGTAVVTGFSSLSELATKINDAGIGLKASYDATIDRFFLSTSGMGEATTVQVTNDSFGLFIGANQLNMNLDLSIPQKGVDAEINFDGANGIKYASNQFTLNGIQVELKQEGGGPQTIKIDTDVDGAYNKIKVFVDKYNELIGKLNGKTSEKQYRDFQPLTNEQKEAMSEDDIKNWEEKAKSGLLRNDDAISKTVQTMRSGLYETVQGITGTYSQIATIGITTGEWKDNGKLVIDEAKLKEAIINDVDGVMNLLFKESTAADPATKRNESGLMNRLFDDAVSGMKEIIEKSGTGDNADLYRSVKSNILIDFVTNMGSISYLDKDILNLEESIYNEEERLISKEEAYWSKFTAMEKALQQMSSQSAWLTQQFSS
ncbi:flagellar filament capping protein FliD [Anaerosolibacter sp.]|uniref:flagellar filament capping protein FliD n=1 Tax=Anaerosolibacter sp. TaxID=1872527 RepID=UPI0039EFA1B0